MAGRIIKAVIRSDLSCHSVDTRMNALRSTLEDWMSLEIKTGKLDGPEFFDVYYNDTESDMAFQKAVKSRAGIVEILGGLKQCLLAAYPDCAPLRQQIQRIDMSVSLINKMERAGK
ncbi:hypothetical protein C0V82_08160 [Niveispirillum cyanobacteriorum]|uniref:DUF5623 domain-containing protein n=2 Tax=Niveispirillum cyanobacteriorum TaxID=1612173 RepID=A0A2K9NAV5_9PROT|nr:hypothetical protein C0V82_08160 [Niveispirillum cyanobacteriorum]